MEYEYRKLTDEEKVWLHELDNELSRPPTSLVGCCVRRVKGELNWYFHRMTPEEIAAHKEALSDGS
jgi:hypothetical protein